MKQGDASCPRSVRLVPGCGSSAGHDVPHAVAGFVSCLPDIGGQSLADPVTLGLTVLAVAGAAVVSLITMVGALATG